MWCVAVPTSSNADPGPPRDAPPAAQVALLVDTRALDAPLDYAIPAELAGRVEVGTLVACPLNRRTVLGIVTGCEPPTWSGTLAPLHAVVDGVPAVTPQLMELAGWVSRYFAAPHSVCLKLVLPPGAEGTLQRSADGGWRLRPPPTLRRLLVAHDPVIDNGTPRQRAIAQVLAGAGGELSAAELCRRAATTLPTLRRMAEAGVIGLREDEPLSAATSGASTAEAPSALPPTLTDEQGVAVARIATALADGTPAMLLHGITGSGKTEVYLQAIDRARAAGRGTLVLVPEIALTPQLLGRLRTRLGENIAVWHSALTPAERMREDTRVRNGVADVVLGARSAVFAPIPNLGLIIVDEEHESSYKQDSSPRYDARHVAYRRAQLQGALVVYGSATPRPESWKALPRVSLTHRADGAMLPTVEVVDMRMQSPGPVSRPLAQGLLGAVERGEKAIILLNRRGLARLALCRACGWIGRCPDCDVPLVIHNRPEQLVCHHCGRDEPLPHLCPACGAAEVGRQGTGTQGLEEALAQIIPDVPLIRLDADVTRTRGELVRRLDRFARPGAAVLLGTQMVAKGHDLPAVTVAGILDADGPLQQPDFRAEERALSLIVQLAGRAGRRGEPATVYVQAWEPASRAIQLGARHDVETFLTGELERRREQGFPPFGSLVRVVLDGENTTALDTAAAVVADELREMDARLTIYGPARLHRLRARARRAVLVRADRSSLATASVRALVDAHADRFRRGGIRVMVDVDPQGT